MTRCQSSTTPLPSSVIMSSPDVDVISINDSSDDDEPLRPSYGSPSTKFNSPPSRLTPEVHDSESESGDNRSPRPAIRLRRRSVEVEDVSQREELGFILDDCNDPDKPTIKRPHKLPTTTDPRRKAFRDILERMETPQDIQLLYPKSLHPKSENDEYICEEASVLREFVSTEQAEYEEEDEMYEELEIYDFSIYRGLLQNRHRFHNWGQLENLHYVASEKDNEDFLLDGLVCQDGNSRRINGAVITEVNIGNTPEPSASTTAKDIWVQTFKSQHHHKCWYRLCVPSAEYSQTWHDFLWLADLNKHLIDYLWVARSRSETIYLGHFASQFWDTLTTWHGENDGFKAWGARTKHTDFRKHLTINTDFFRNQAWGVCEDNGCWEIMRHPIWDEMAAGLYKYDQQNNSSGERTVVTPAIGTAFLPAFPLWGPAGYDLLEVLPPSPATMGRREQRRRKLGFPNKAELSSQSQFHTPHTDKKPPSKVSLLLEQAATTNKITQASPKELLGKVVVVRPKATYIGSRHRDTDQNFRFAWVKELAASGKSLRVVWLVPPSETICGSDYDRTHYPIGNELFFTDRCNCKPVSLTNVVAAYEASTFDRNSSKPGMIVQLLYREEDEVFVTPVESELLCTCQRPRSSKVEASRTPLEKPNVLMPAPKLRNMSLFSGCGLLDFGLEESGFFETRYAIDHSEVAIRSHSANNKSKGCRHVIGSVNLYLERFLTGEEEMPEIDSITAGYPCKGFSLLNKYRYEEKSQRNCSLLSSTLSWIELFLPLFVIIENVPQMQHIPERPDLANACAQAICCLVALGYQVRKMLLTASDYGSPTDRRRVFLVAAAPGLVLPEVPPVTHGEESELEPFVTVRDAIRDLDPIHNDLTVNIHDPSHIPIQRLQTLTKWGVSLRNVVQRIPKIAGEGLFQAYENGLLLKEQKIWFTSRKSKEKDRTNSKALRRIHPDSCFKTIVTVVSPLDSRFGGEIVHPWEDRLLSLKEIGRAQGTPDSFLLVGNLRQQIELLGSGVAWQVGAALGRSVGTAWTTSHLKVASHYGEQHQSVRHYILQTPLKMTAHFTETRDSVNELHQAKEVYSGPRSDAVQLQRDLIETAIHDENMRISRLLEGDTVIVDVPNSVESSPEPRQERDTRHEFPEGKARFPSPTLEGDQNSRTEASPPTRTTRSQSREVLEDVYETSDHESFLFTPDGRAVNYQRDRRSKLTRRSSSAAKRKERVVVEIPVRKKRAASPTPSPSPSSTAGLAAAREEDSDLDIVYVETRRPAVKKVRVH